MRSSSSATLGDDPVLPHALEAWSRHMQSPVHAGRLRAGLAAGTLPDSMRAAARSAGDHLAIDIGGERITHADLHDRAGRFGGWLARNGVRPGDRVLVAGRTSLELVIAYLGIVRARAAMVPADPQATADELAHLVADSGAVAAWASQPALQRLGGLDALRLTGALDGDDANSVTAAVADGPELDAQSRPGDVVMLAYTSGTTGRPKGVPLSHRNLLASLRGALWAWRWGPADVVVHALPLSHQHGLSGVQMALLTGSSAVLLERFDPERLCAAIERNRATIVLAVPAMYERLAVWEGFGQAGLETARLWVSGSAPLSPALAETLAEVLGRPPLERYGSTEAGLCVSNPAAGPRRPGSVGLPLPGLEMAIVDGSGARVENGGEGEIVLRGPQVFDGYWRRPETRAETFFDGGWFRTGDLGRVDPADGYLQITGRLKEMILSGGLNVYPREVELVLEDHPSVRRAAVVGIPSQRWGEEVVAFVVGAAGERLDDATLLAHARARLSAYKCPKRVIAVPDLPVTSTGKVRRGELASMAQNLISERQEES